MSLNLMYISNGHNYLTGFLNKYQKLCLSLTKHINFVNLKFHLTKHTPTFCILDNDLLEDNLQLLEWLRINYSGPIIVLTAHCNRAKSYLNAGATDYISKDNLSDVSLQKTIDRSIISTKFNQKLSQTQEILKQCNT